MRVHATFDCPGNANRIAANLAEILDAVGARSDQPPLIIYCAMWLQLNAGRPLGRVARAATVALFALLDVLFALVPIAWPSRRGLYLSWLGLRVSFFLTGRDRYRCAYCGRRTNLSPTVTAEGAFLPSCCTSESCLDRWHAAPPAEAA